MADKYCIPSLISKCATMIGNQSLTIYDYNSLIGISKYYTANVSIMKLISLVKNKLANRFKVRDSIFMHLICCTLFYSVLLICLFVYLFFMLYIQNLDYILTHKQSDLMALSIASLTAIIQRYIYNGFAFFFVFFVFAHLFIYLFIVNLQKFIPRTLYFQ